MEEPTPQVSIEAINPEIAAEMLELNIDHNRGIRQARVDAYATDMRNGDWDMTGEPITFDWNGHLCNGQHRLHAIIKSQASLEFVVVRGVDPLSVIVTDTGKARTLGDSLTFVGYKHGDKLGATVLTAGMYEHYMDDKLHLSSNSDATEPIKFRIHKAPFPVAIPTFTRTSAMNLLERRPGLEDSIEAVKTVAGHRRGQVVRPPVGPLALMHDIAKHGYGGASVIEFAEAVRIGTGMVDDPAQVLHGMVERHHARAADRIPFRAMRLLWFRAYGAWADDIPVKQLRRTKGSTYPVIPGDVEWYLAGVDTP